MKNKFRISHSLLNLWTNGLVDQAISTYFHLNEVDNPKMKEGRDLHKRWADSIKSKKKLVLGATTLIFDTPRVEFGENGELNKPYNELWDIGGRFDCLDGGILYEFKSGTKNALDYAGEYQIPFYFLLGELSGLSISKAMVVHHNQFLNKTDLVIVWNNEVQIERARNFIDSTGYEVYKYFLDNGLI